MQGAAGGAWWFSSWCRMSEWLARNLTETLNLPQPAVDWLLSLFNTIQVFDDITDGDSVDANDLRAAIFDSLAGFWLNPFFREHSALLVPLIAVNVHKWQAANTVEASCKHGPVSFVWRAGFYDIVLMVVSICHGPKAADENAHIVMALYGESFDEYMKEFGNA